MAADAGQISFIANKRVIDLTNKELYKSSNNSYLDSILRMPAKKRLIYFKEYVYPMVAQLYNKPNLLDGSTKVRQYCMQYVQAVAQVYVQTFNETGRWYNAIGRVDFITSGFSLALCLIGFANYYTNRELEKLHSNVGINASIAKQVLDNADSYLRFDKVVRNKTGYAMVMQQAISFSDNKTPQTTIFTPYGDMTSETNMKAYTLCDGSEINLAKQHMWRNEHLSFAFNVIPKAAVTHWVLPLGTIASVKLTPDIQYGAFNTGSYAIATFDIVACLKKKIKSVLDNATVNERLPISGYYICGDAFIRMYDNRYLSRKNITYNALTDIVKLFKFSDVVYYNETRLAQLVFALGSENHKVMITAFYVWLSAMSLYMSAYRYSKAGKFDTNIKDVIKALHLTTIVDMPTYAIYGYDNSVVIYYDKLGHTILDYITVKIKHSYNYPAQKETISSFTLYKEGISRVMNEITAMLVSLKASLNAKLSYADIEDKVSTVLKSAYKGLSATKQANVLELELLYAKALINIETGQMVITDYSKPVRAIMSEKLGLTKDNPIEIKLNTGTSSISKESRQLVYQYLK